jgi:hypothetical protein
MSNPISKRAVSDYVEIQAREKVQHAERVTTEHVLGHDQDNARIADGRKSRKKHRTRRSQMKAPIIIGSSFAFSMASEPCINQSVASVYSRPCFFRPKA